MGWDREFDDPVPNMRTLRDAANYVVALPKREQQQPHWQLAVEMLLTAAEGRGPLMFARIAMLRALNHGKPAPPPAPRKKPARKVTIVR